jgi:ABC-type sugar transport system ATPase subunit
MTRTTPAAIALRLLAAACNRAGTTGRSDAAMLLVSSYFPELPGVCDRIAVMRGRLELRETCPNGTSTRC